MRSSGKEWRWADSIRSFWAGRPFCRDRAWSRADIGIKDGRVSVLGEGLASGDAEEVVDAAGKLVLPGAVDAHFHLGIYRDITEDTQQRDALIARGGRHEHYQLLQDGQPLPRKEWSLRGDLPRGTRRDERAFACRLRVSSGPDGPGSDLRDPPPRLRRGRHLLQVLHVLQGARPRGRLERRQRLHDERELRPRPPLRDHGAGGESAGDKRLAGLALHPLRAARADPGLLGEGQARRRPLGPRSLQRLAPDVDRAPRRRRGRRPRRPHALPHKPSPPLQRGGFTRRRWS